MFLEGGEEMDMVRHDDVATDENAMVSGFFGKGTEGLMDKRLGEDRHAVVGTEGDEVEKLVGMNSIETGKTRRMHGSRRRS